MIQAGDVPLYIRSSHSPPVVIFVDNAAPSVADSENCTNG
jgi:hypothetical protein